MTSPITTERAVRVLVGGLGYRYLRDESVGPWAAEQLEARAGQGVESVGPWAAEQLEARAGQGVEVEDLSYHPVGFIHNLQEREPYDRLVVVASARRGRPPGTITTYRWDRALPDRDAIQERVSEAVTGVISLDNLLIVTEALGDLPPDVRVVEVEPGLEGWGDGFGPEVAARLDDVLETVWSLTAP